MKRLILLLVTLGILFVGSVIAYADPYIVPASTTSTVVITSNTPSN